MYRYPNDVDTVEAAVIEPTAAGFRLGTWERLGGGKFWLHQRGTFPTRAAAAAHLYRAIERMDNPEMEAA
jgi:hypothetical protein